MARLSVFANFYINDEERYLRLQDSFFSFHTSVDEWIINVRGSFKENVESFLKDNIPTKSTFKIYHLESQEGWFHDSRKIVGELSGDFVFVWIEDHININPQKDILKEIIAEMSIQQTEYLTYSWFKQINNFKDVNKNRTVGYFIESFDLDSNEFIKVQQSVPGEYIISLVSICDIKLFNKIINSDDEAQMIKWKKHLPFDFEKSSFDLHWLPLRYGVLKTEVFVSIDDDINKKSLSLISRGLYPARREREKPFLYPGMMLRNYYRFREFDPLENIRLIHAIKLLLRALKNYIKRLTKQISQL